MEFIEQRAVKLLAQAARQMSATVAECLCGEPDKALVRSMIADIRDMLDEFEDAYFDEPAGR